MAYALYNNVAGVVNGVSCTIKASLVLRRRVTRTGSGVVGMYYIYIYISLSHMLVGQTNLFINPPFPLLFMFFFFFFFWQTRKNVLRSRKEKRGHKKIKR